MSASKYSPAELLSFKNDPSQVSIVLRKPGASTVPGTQLLPSDTLVVFESYPRAIIVNFTRYNSHVPELPPGYGEVSPGLYIGRTATGEIELGPNPLKPRLILNGFDYKGLKGVLEFLLAYCEGNAARCWPPLNIHNQIDMTKVASLTVAGARLGVHAIIDATQDYIAGHPGRTEAKVLREVVLKDYSRMLSEALRMVEENSIRCSILKLGDVADGTDAKDDGSNPDNSKDGGEMIATAGEGKVQGSSKTKKRNRNRRRKKGVEKNGEDDGEDDGSKQEGGGNSKIELSKEAAWTESNCSSYEVEPLADPTASGESNACESSANENLENTEDSEDRFKVDTNSNSVNQQSTATFGELDLCPNWPVSSLCLVVVMAVATWIWYY